MRLILVILLGWVVAGAALAGDYPRVVVSIRPLHSLVQGVLGGVAEAQLLVEGASSPHQFHLKPSQMQLLRDADFVFYVDDAFERFLPAALKSVGEGVTPVALARIDGVRLLSARGRGDAHEAGHDEHEAGGEDLHFWLEPEYAKAVVRETARQLSRKYPDSSSLFMANAAVMIQKLDVLDHRLEKILREVTDRPFFVFHDAYQYFETAYGLHYRGALMLDVSVPMSAARLQTVRAQLQQEPGVCVFREPSFPGEMVQRVTDGLPVKHGVLDPLGVELEPGETLYFHMMQRLAEAMWECFIASDSLMNS